MFEYLHHEYLVGIYLSNFYKKNLIFIVRKKDNKSKYFFKCLGVKNIIFYDEKNLIFRYRNLIKSFFTFNKIKSIKQLLNFKDKSILVGKMLYSHHVRFSGVPTINEIVPDLYFYYSQYLNYSEIFKKILNENNIESLVQAETQFMPGSVLAAHALKKRISIYSRLGTDRISLRKINNINDHSKGRNFYDEKIIKKIRKNKNSQRLINFGKKILHDRFFKNTDIEIQEIDEYFKRPKILKNKRLKTKSDICKLYNWKIKKPVGIILANDLTDGLFEIVNPIYKDNYVWLKETLKEASKNKNINWLVKPHPREETNNVRLRTRELVLNSFQVDNIKVLPKNYVHKELIKIVDVVLTNHGTAGYEYPAFGIPAINASDPPYRGLNISIKPKNLNEYKKLIKNLHNKFRYFKFDRKKRFLIYISLLKFRVG